MHYSIAGRLPQPVPSETKVILVLSQSVLGDGGREREAGRMDAPSVFAHSGNTIPKKHFVF